MTEIGMILLVIAVVGIWLSWRRSRVLKWTFGTALVVGLLLMLISIMTFLNMPD